MRAVRLCEQFNFPSESSCYWHTGVPAAIHETTSGFSSTSNSWEITRQKTISLLREAAENLHYKISDEQLVAWESRGINPPVAMEFETGEHPAISLYGHHFRGCDSKIILRDPTPTETIVPDIYKTFDQFFPEHAYFYDESMDNYESDRYYAPGSRYQMCVSNETDEELDRFYDQLIQES